MATAIFELLNHIEQTRGVDGIDAVCLQTWVQFKIVL